MYRGARHRVYHRAMAKGDFSSLKIDNFGRGINLVDPLEEMDTGYLGPSTTNVLPIGKGNSLENADGAFVTQTFVNSTTRRPNELIKYLNGLIVSNLDGSVDRLAQTNGVVTSIGVVDGAGPPAVVVSQDSALSQYYAYIIRSPATSLNNTKVNLSTAASVTWPGSPPSGVCGISWKTMMVIGAKSRIRFSTQGNPDSWPANNFIDIKTLDDASDDIVGFEILGEDLIVFKKRSTWMVFDPVTFDNRRLFSVGLVCRKAVSRLDDRIFWIGTDSIYSTDGSTLKNEAVKLGLNGNTSTFALWLGGAGGLPNTDCSLTCSPDGRVVASDANLCTFVGYSNSRDFNGDMPWYKLSGVQGFLPIDTVWNNQNFGSSDIYSDSENNRFLGIILQSTNNQFLAPILDSGVASQFLSSSIAVQGVIELPTFHNPSVEDISRLRRLNLYGHGTFGNTGVAAIEIYKDNGALAFTKPAGAFTNEFMRVRPEMRAKNFVVRIRSDGLVPNFQLHSVEAQFRKGGR